jgi:hypothetical protein
MTDAPVGQGQVGWPAGPSGPRNGLGTAALVCGIVGFLLAIVVLGGILGIVAVVLGIVALGRVRRGEANNRGVAIGGIVTGALAIVLAGIIVAAGAAFWAENEDEINDFRDCIEDAQGDERAEQECSDRFERELEQNN